MSDIQYAIYCRKSTDESSGRQVQSISDQMKACVDYAERNNLSILPRPANFSDFETEAEIVKQDTDDNAEVYQKYRNLFIIKEQKTGKEPWVRPKRKALMKLIKQWKINWLLSYSPDRQARNMVDGGTIIDFVDKGLVDLQYSTFNFEPNANGKMMLGIWFVFAKQYSDKVWEDSRRWVKSSLKEWHAMWLHKWGYDITEDGFHIPNPDYFPVMRKAFELKLFEEKTDKQISEWLIWQGFKKYSHQYKRQDPKAKELWKVWRDPFYYGLFIYWANEIDLREWKNDHYQSIITEKEYNLMIHKIHEKNNAKNYTKNNSNAEVRPLPDWFLVTDEWYAVSHEIPNRKRHIAKLEKLIVNNPHASLKDVIEPHHIKYSSRPRWKSELNISVSYDIIDKQILKMLSNVKVDEKKFQEYRNYLANKFANDSNNKISNQRALQLQLNKLQAERDSFIENMMTKKLDSKESEIYQKKKQDYNHKLSLIKNEMDFAFEESRNLIYEFEILCNVVTNAASYYKDADYVRRWKIIQLFCSNIVLDNQKRLHFAVKPWLNLLFSNNLTELWGARTRT